MLGTDLGLPAPAKAKRANPPPLMPQESLQTRSFMKNIAAAADKRRNALDPFAPLGPLFSAHLCNFPDVPAGFGYVQGD